MSICTICNGLNGAHLPLCPKFDSDKEFLREENKQLRIHIANVRTRCSAAEAVCNAFDGVPGLDMETAMSAWHRIIESIPEI